jgi:hypothetical protein
LQETPNIEEKCMKKVALEPSYGSDSIFSSPELKAQVSFTDHLLSGVRLSVRL